MKRLMEKIVFSGFVTCWRLAGTPTSRSPPCVKATTEGVVRPPSRFGITVGSPPPSTPMHELVGPRSMPIVFAIPNLLQIAQSQGLLDGNRRNRSLLIADLGQA